jgi:hypothetical protein
MNFFAELKRRNVFMQIGNIDQGVFVRFVCGRSLRALSCAMAKPDAVYKNFGQERSALALHRDQAKLCPQFSR